MLSHARRQCLVLFEIANSRMWQIGGSVCETGIPISSSFASGHRVEKRRGFVAPAVSS
jgi:hypothetical protein